MEGSGTLLDAGFLYGPLSPDPLVSPLMPVEMTSEENPDCGPAVSCCSSCARFVHRHKLLDPGPDLSSSSLHARLGCWDDRVRVELLGPVVESKSFAYHDRACPLDPSRPGLSQSLRGIHHHFPHQELLNKSTESYSFYPASTLNQLLPSLLICLLLFLYFVNKVNCYQTHLDFIPGLLIRLLLLCILPPTTLVEILKLSWNHVLLASSKSVQNSKKFSTGVEQTKVNISTSVLSELTFSPTLALLTKFINLCKLGYSSEQISSEVKTRVFYPAPLQINANKVPQTYIKLSDSKPSQSGTTLDSYVCGTKISLRILKRPEEEAGAFREAIVRFLTYIFPFVANLGRASYTPRLFQHLPMGCILPKHQKNLGLEGDIKVYDLHAIIDPHPTTLIENSPTVLKYQTPHFRASARVRFPPVSGNDTWQIGWVQGCNNMDFTISYGNLGTSSWEIPSLKTNQQRFVSDSDGKHYPWYGCTTEVATIPGPTSCYSTFHLRMNDNFHPSITWDIPVRNSHQVRLTKLARDQSFTVWLIAMNKTTGQKFVLRTIKWRMRINIAVDETQPLGRRAQLLDPIIQEQPHILEPWQNEVAPPEALRAPNANNAQTLIWRPSSGGEVVIVPPVSHH